jgi:hypothetical protein
MGCVGGGAWHLVKGLKASPTGFRMKGALEVGGRVLPPNGLHGQVRELRWRRRRGAGPCPGGCQHILQPCTAHRAEFYTRTRLPTHF